MRVTNQIIMRRALANLEANSERLMKLHDQISTGRRVNRPSDDPSITAQAMGYRTTLELQDQYLATIDAGLRRLNTTDVAYSTLTDVIQRAHELGVRAGSGLLAQAELNAVAAEIDQLLSQAIQVGNISIGGIYVFGGHQTTAAPFTAVGAPVTSVTYNGDTGLVNMEVGPGLTIPVNVPGSTTLPDIFNVLISMRDNLQAGNVAAVESVDLPQLMTTMDDLLNLRGVVGARVNRLERDRAAITDAQLATRELLADAEEVDMADVLVKLTSQQNVYQASLKTTARVVQPTLMDFLQ